MHSQSRRLNLHKEENQGLGLEKTFDLYIFLIVEYYNRVYIDEPKKNWTGNKGEASKGLVWYPS